MQCSACNVQCAYIYYRRSYGHDTHESIRSRSFCRANAPESNKRFKGFVNKKYSCIELATQRKAIFMLEIFQLASVCNFTFQLCFRCALFLKNRCHKFQNYWFNHKFTHAFDFKIIVVMIVFVHNIDEDFLLPFFILCHCIYKIWMWILAHAQSCIENVVVDYVPLPSHMSHID